jgi:hypothetical protein
MVAQQPMIESATVPEWTEQWWCPPKTVEHRLAVIDLRVDSSGVRELAEGDRMGGAVIADEVAGGDRSFGEGTCSGPGE